MPPGAGGTQLPLAQGGPPRGGITPRQSRSRRRRRSRSHRSRSRRRRRRSASVQRKVRDLEEGTGRDKGNIEREFNHWHGLGREAGSVLGDGAPEAKREAGGRVSRLRERLSKLQPLKAGAEFDTGSTGADPSSAGRRGSARKQLRRVRRGHAQGAEAFPESALTAATGSSQRGDRREDRGVQGHPHLHRAAAGGRRHGSPGRARCPRPGLSCFLVARVPGRHVHRSRGPAVGA